MDLCFCDKILIRRAAKQKRFEHPDPPDMAPMTSSATQKQIFANKIIFFAGIRFSLLFSVVLRMFMEIVGMPRGCERLQA